jgi:hypothetical protein
LELSGERSEQALPADDGDVEVEELTASCDKLDGVSMAPRGAVSVAPQGL